MNDLVKNSVEARKQAIYNSYNIEGTDIESKIKDLFNEIEKFASNYNDVMDFENAFMASELNQKYTNIFSEIATKCTPKAIETNNAYEDTTYNETSDAEYVLDELSRPVRRQARQQVDDTLRSTPIIGDVMEVKQHIDFFGRFKKSKTDEEEK